MSELTGRTPEEVRSEIKSTRHKAELPLYAITIILSFITIIVLWIFMFRDSGALDSIKDVLATNNITDASPEFNQVLLVCIGFISLIGGIGCLAYFVITLLVGYYKLYAKEMGYSIRVSEKNFPELYAYVKEFTKNLGLKKEPEVYVTQTGSINAFACWVPGNYYIQINAEILAGSKNAVVAMNGDFCKYENDVGYLVRQGEVVRDATGNARGQIFDMLLIDSAGDFHVVDEAVTETIDAYSGENLTPNGLTVMDTFNIGPVLVRNGAAVDVSQSTMTRMKSNYQWTSCIERIAVVQTGKLEYAIVTVGTKSKTSGLTMQEFAEFVAEKCPDAILAYNLDGGGSANLTGTRQKRNGTLYHDRLNRNNDLRPITDILYFASAED